MGGSNAPLPSVFPHSAVGARHDQGGASSGQTGSVSSSALRQDLGPRDGSHLLPADGGVGQDPQTGHGGSDESPAEPGIHRAQGGATLPTARPGGKAGDHGG